MSKRYDKSTAFENVFTPSYSPEQQKLLRNFDTYKASEELQEGLKKKIEEVEKLLGSEQQPQEERLHQPRGLTQEEAEAVLKKRKEMLKTIDRVRGKVDAVKDILKKQHEDGEKSYVYKFKKKPRLKKALRVVLGKKENNITYEDYTKALEIKKALEQQEVKDLQEWPEDF